jgi:Uma2 family endonuclease
VPAPPLQKFTPEEYLLIERAAEFRSEYHEGEIYAMSGGSLRHAAVADECMAQVQLVAEKRGCQAYRADVRVRAGTGRSYFYPDVVVVCGAPVMSDEYGDTTAITPQATQDFDRGGKFDAYAQLPSLREYVLVWQDQPKVVVFTRQAKNQWLRTEVAGLDADVQLMGEEVALRSIYRRVEF